MSALLALIWLCAGVAALVVGAVEHRWFLSLTGAAGLWYGIIWVLAARQGRQLTLREALMPWCLRQRSDI